MIGSKMLNESLYFYNLAHSMDCNSTTGALKTHFVVLSIYDTPKSTIAEICFMVRLDSGAAVNRSRTRSPKSHRQQVQTFCST